MTDEDKPMPCPFCGKSESYVTDVGHRWFQVVCECGARGPMEDPEAEALARWNAAGQELARLRMIETVAVNLNAMRPHFGTAKYVNAMDELAIAVKHSRSAIKTTPKWSGR